MSREDLAFRLSWCIEEYASSKGCSTAAVAELFSKKGVLDFLTDHAEILHTQGKNYILSAISEYVNT